MSQVEMAGTPPLVELAGAAAVSSEPHEGTQTFTKTQVMSVMLIGVIGSLVGALQPLLLGPLAQEGRLTLQEMGQTAMFEALGMAIAIAVSGAVLRPSKLKLIVVLAALVSLLANVTTVYASHETVLLARLVNGLSAGIMLWVWTGLLTHIALPARLVAIFVSIQSAGVLALSWLFSGLVIPRWGASGGYGALAISCVIIALLALGTPRAYREHGGGQEARFALPSGRGFAGLLAVVMHLAAVMSVWVYVLPLGRQNGLAEGFVALTVSVALAAQIAGGLFGAIFARLNAKVALYGSISASLMALALVGTGTGPVPFMVGLTVVSFFWMFAPGFQMPYLLEIDPSRRAGMQMITAQLLGLSTGPALASFAVHRDDIAPALGVSAALFIAAAVLLFATTTLRSRKAIAGTPSIG